MADCRSASRTCRAERRGQTTTLEILEGFRAPTAGLVRVLGLDPAVDAAKLRQRAGMVLQECGFPRQARVAELLDLWRTYYPKPRPLGDLLEVVELVAHGGRVLVKALAQILEGAYTMRPFPARDLANLGFWTAAGAGFVAWRFCWHN